MENEKFRHEFKYITSDDQFACLRSRLAGVMKYDSNADGEGKYLIRSVYFDDFQDSGYYENENGTDPREKYRVRIYDHSPDRIQLENKRKMAGMTQKQACTITRQMCDVLLEGKQPFLEMGDSPVWNRFATMWNTRQFRPKVIVEYERTVFVCPLGNVRVTLDRNIASSTDFAHFFDKYIIRRPIMASGKHILEVKYDQFLPDYIYKGTEMTNLQRTNFSKYYLGRRYDM